MPWIDVPAIELEDGKWQAAQRHYVEPPPVPDPAPYTESELLVRFGWTAEDFRQARELYGFPASIGRGAKGMTIVNRLIPRVNVHERLYRATDVDRWIESLR